MDQFRPVHAARDRVGKRFSRRGSAMQPELRNQAAEGGQEIALTHVAIRPGKRRVLRDTPVDQLLERLGQGKAGVRANAEHPFHVVKNLFKHRKRRHLDLAKNIKQRLNLFGLAKRRLAERRLLAKHPQTAP